MLQQPSHAKLLPHSILQNLLAELVRLVSPHHMAAIRSAEWELTSFLIVSIKEYRSKLARSVSMPFTMRRLAPAVHSLHLAEKLRALCYSDVRSSVHGQIGATTLLSSDH